METKKLSRTPFLVSLLVLILCFFALIRPFLLPALFAMLVVVIFNPAYCRLENICGGRRYPAAFIATLLVLLCVIVPMGAVIGFVISNIVILFNYVASQLEMGQLAQELDLINQWINQRSAEYAAYLPQGLDLRSTLIETLKSAGKILYQYSPKVVSATASVVTGLLLMIVFIFVLFAEGKNIFRSVMSLLPLEEEHKIILSHEVRGVISGTFLGMLATSVSQAILIGIGFWIAGISQPLVWGVVALGVTLVPVIGGPLMYVPAAVSLFFGDRTGPAVFVLLWGIFVVSTIDNFIKPLILRGKVKVNPVLLALGIVGGGLWLGPSGVVVGPVVVVLMMAMLKIYQREFN